MIEATQVIILLIGAVVLLAYFFDRRSRLFYLKSDEGFLVALYFLSGGFGKGDFCAFNAIYSNIP